MHIGKEIEKRVGEKGISHTKFADRINISRNNVYDIYKRESINTDLLVKIGKVLDYNFFKLFIKDDAEANKKSKAKIVLEFEVDAEDLGKTDIKRKFIELMK